MTILEKVQAGCKEYTLIEKVGFNHEQGNLFKVMNNMTGEISVKCTGELKNTRDTTYNNYSGRRKYSVSTHGMTGTSFYHQWKQMKSRCNNSTQHGHEIYCLVGYCEEWEKFDNFKRDMYDSYEPGLTIDRIDNSKGYFKDNCRWVTKEQQMRNKKNNLKVQLFKEIPYKAFMIDIADAFGVNRVTAFRRIKKDASPDNILRPTRASIKKMDSMTEQQKYEFICQSNEILEPILEEALEQYCEYYDNDPFFNDITAE